ncbi:alpha/beta hydrolase [Streptomyces sp. NBC_00285]|uniref:alpha/beta hydrolase n=1 Tax=Streptomyces sp. NBC_00285 TaxID=2975700 RepID=UPI002E286254|nr:alpha/beta hydrolase fold domain-containing protein [Streptomyces sp. NBC_00285]
MTAPIDESLALATIGHEYARESVLAGEQLKSRLTTLYDVPDGMTFAQYRATVRFGDDATVPTARDLTIEGVHVRSFTPETPSRGEYLHLHGGGWCLGSHTTHDETLQQLADRTALTVTSIGYRMAPEHRYPACLDDVLAVARAVSERPSVKFLAIGGESAGAHLAALTVLELSERLGRQPFSAVSLNYGAFDLTAGLDRALALLMPGATVEDRSAASPLLAELNGVPAARFCVGTGDALLAQTLSMEARWREHASTELDVFAGAAHAFTTVRSTAARVAKIREAEFLCRRLDAGTARTDSR